ncbi:NADH:flavin oxidoreductase/NADH oxidase family protein [Alteromonadaceae bacterium M269]|nr:NADH:flavin oxidoreductase/NADH oxidase family protein [Alteromonadaceae bacterium M269]
MPNSAFSTIELPCGLVLKNRIAKAAMEENLAESNQLPGELLINLYRKWAAGGSGLIITGNVMIDHLAMTGPGGVALEKDSDLAPFQRLAAAGKENGAAIWMQINHPGRQVFKNMGGKVLSPSNVALNMGKHSKMFSQPDAMTEEQIQDVIQRFVVTATRAEEAGFDGVEVHAAHGYLIAQFLSPLTNKREDEWGGSIENRARLLVEVIRAIREKVAPTFAVAVKLNSADFQRGGFDVDDAQQVVNLIADLGVDMVELSGGSYEAPAMQGRTADGRTLEREAYFLTFAEQIGQSSKLPIMTTGGVRRLAVADKVIDSGVAMVGMASALASTPDLPNQWLEDSNITGDIPLVSWKDKTLSGLATMAIIKRNLRRVGAQKSPVKNASPLLSLILDQVRKAKLTKRYRQRYQQELESLNSD